MRLATGRSRSLSISLFLGGILLAWTGAYSHAQPGVVDAPSVSGRLPPALTLKRDDAGEEPGRAMLAWGIVVFGAIAATAYVVLRRTGHLPRPMSAGARAEDSLRRRAHVPLTSQASVHVVQWEGTHYLLGVTAQQITLLATNPLPQSGAPAGGAKKDGSP